MTDSSPNTQADFYLLDTNSPEKLLLFVCRLVEKAMKPGNRIYICCRDEEQVQHLDELLYSYRPDSFLPHEPLADADARTPVIVAGSFEPLNQPDVVINLNPAPCLHKARIAEIVLSSPEEKALSRTKFKAYKDAGFEMQTHTLAI